MSISECEDGDNRVFWTNIQISKQLDKFNYNSNLDIGIQNMNENIKKKDNNILYRPVLNFCKERLKISNLS